MHPYVSISIRRLVTKCELHHLPAVVSVILLARLFGSAAPVVQYLVQADFNGTSASMDDASEPLLSNLYSVMGFE
jgi:hypothetical protein